MKKIFAIGAAAAALLAAPTLAQQARGGPDQGQGVTRAQAETRVRDMFARVDANRDGFVTQAEAGAFRSALQAKRGANRAERREARFAQLDANRDGSISRAEFLAQPGTADRGERRGQRAERRGQRGGFAARLGNGRLFERLDADRDGRVSLAEATSAARFAPTGRPAAADCRQVRSKRAGAAMLRPFVIGLPPAIAPG
jgi:hypothetical protein